MNCVFLDDIVEFKCGCKVTIDDFWDLIDRLRTENSDHTSGWHLTEEHLEVENTGIIILEPVKFEYFHKWFSFYFNLTKFLYHQKMKNLKNF